MAAESIRQAATVRAPTRSPLVWRPLLNEDKITVPYQSLESTSENAQGPSFFRARPLVIDLSKSSS
jgi:hypothetical protein